MENNISRADLETVISFLKTEPILTNSTKCLEFEKKWSEWLGCKYSLFVNSGSSANILTLALLKEMYGDGEIIVPPLTWVSDIVAVLNAGFKPVFVDINPKSLAIDTDLIIEHLTPKTRAVFLTHVLGLNGLTARLLGELKRRNIHLIEDVCESHGATFDGRKLGTYGYVSNFSYYYAHHMSTIEGGMICTDDEEFYEHARMYRSHGMIRESKSEAIRNQYISEHPDLNPQFIFAHPGFNFRSTEINAVLGLSQLPSLDANNLIRNRNFEYFLKHLSKERFYTDFDLTGQSNYALILVLRDEDERLRDRLTTAMTDAGIEFRRGTSGGGNQLRQPYLKKILGEPKLENFPNVEHIHFFGFYIGNYPSLTDEKVMQLCEFFNNVG